MRATARPVSLLEAVDGAMPFTADAARAIAERVLEFVSAPDALVTVEGTSTGFTEFAGNALTDASDTRYASVSVTTAYGQRSAVVTTTRLDEAALRSAVEKAQALAASARIDEVDDTESPRSPGTVNPALWHESALENLTPQHRADVVRDVIGVAGVSGLGAAGVVGTAARSIAVLTSGGHFEFGRTSTSVCTVAARADDGDGSGWASWKGEDWTRARPAALAARAADLARRTRKARAIEPGRYTVVLSPVAMADLIGTLASLGALDGRSADDGQSPFARANGDTAVGEELFDDRVTLSADPMDAEGGFLPFAVDGRRIEQYEPVTWVRNGVLERLAYDGVYARARGREAAANAGALRMDGDGVSVDDMVASVGRGIYVTRFSHLELASARAFVLSGVTRDGTFLIERGKIGGAIRSLRFEDSPLRVLRHIVALGTAERVPIGGMPLVMPGAVVTDFQFTGVNDGL